MGTVRDDVDKVAKPILDALKGVLHEDDKQVGSIRVSALSENEPVHLRGAASVMERLQNGEACLINVYVGRFLDVVFMVPRN